MENKVMKLAHETLSAKITRMPLMYGYIASDPVEMTRNMFDTDGDSEGDADGDIPLLTRMDEDYDGFSEMEKKIFGL